MESECVGSVECDAPCVLDRGRDGYALNVLDRGYCRL